MAVSGAADEKDENTASILRSLKTQEAEISKKFGPGVFDYLFLFTDRVNLQIEFPPRLDEISTKELSQYFQTANLLLKQIGMEQYPSTGNPAEDFLNIQRQVFYWRYSGALALFSEYELMRIPTKLETKLMKLKNEEQKNSVGFAIKNAFVIKENGELDFDATRVKEEKENNIKSFLSAFPEAHLLSYPMLQLQSEISSYAMVPRLFEEQLLEINQTIFTEVCAYFAKKVYEYIAKGYTPSEAVKNVQNFYDQLIRSSDYHFPQSLSDLDEIIQNIATEALSQIEELSESTVSELVSEYKELMMYYLRQRKIIPQNFYKLNFRKIEGEELNDMSYDNIVDLYLIDANGETNKQASERYTIDLTSNSKAMIFEFVTNGIENPNFGLTDYLAI